MASTKEYLEYVLEQLSEVDGLRYRPMMGEYLIYCRNRLVGGVYDDRQIMPAGQIMETRFTVSRNHGAEH